MQYYSMPYQSCQTRPEQICPHNKQTEQQRIRSLACTTRDRGPRTTGSETTIVTTDNEPRLGYQSKQTRVHQSLYNLA
eukprot:4343374-Amphidinium_carterae.1